MNTLDMLVERAGSEALEVTVFAVEVSNLHVNASHVSNDVASLPRSVAAHPALLPSAADHQIQLDHVLQKQVKLRLTLTCR